MRLGLAPLHPAYQGRHHGVLQRGKFRQEVMELEHEADGTVPEQGQGRIVPAEDILPVEEHLPGSRPVQGPQDMEQGALPGTGSPDQGNRLARRHLEIDPLQHIDLARLGAE